MSEIRSLSSVARIDAATLVADGLERVARDLRDCKLPLDVRRCLIVLSEPDGRDHDGIAMIHFGIEASMAETVGVLELAKLQAMEAG